MKPAGKCSRSTWRSTSSMDSAEISRESQGTLRELGEAFSSIDLEGDQFIVGGHTDRRGSPAYNQELSERRAEAVRRYLIRHFDIQLEALLAIGYGYDSSRIRTIRWQTKIAAFSW